MKPIKIQFKHAGALRHDDRKKTADLINKIINSAYENKDSLPSQWNKEAQSHLLPQKKKEIEAQLIADNNFFEFTSADYVSLQIKADNPTDTGEYSWEMKFNLLSDTYYCIEILPDKTAVCYNDKNKEIIFVPNSFTILVVE